MSEAHSLTLNPSIFLQLQEEERQRLADALMSGPGQILANALMEIEYSIPLLEKNPPVAVSGLNALREELRDGLTQLKNYVAELDPPLLEEMGLGPSITQYIENFGARTGLRTECRGCQQFRERYPLTIEIALFRILQEAMTNVQIHAQATYVRVQLAHQPAGIRMTVEDNGRGFAPRARSMPKKRQLGLIAMRDRAELLGGQLQLFSEPGQGVRLVVTIPYHGHIAEHSGEHLARGLDDQLTQPDGHTADKVVRPGDRIERHERLKGGQESDERTNDKRTRRTRSAKEIKSGRRPSKTGNR